jgi:septum site-determining protein MinC
VGDAPVDFGRLVEMLRAYRVMPVAVKGGSPDQIEAAKSAGLADGGDALALTPTLSQREREEDKEPKAAPAPAPIPASALVIDKPLRSGQQVYARGRDLVVLSMVNPGAEVVADGHIHVYAPLRGRAIAGARGNTAARIFSTCMEPQLVSIAGTYRTLEAALPDDVFGRPAQVRLDGNAIRVERLAS